MLAKPRGAHGDHPMRRNEPFLDKTRQVELQIGPDKSKIVLDKLAFSVSTFRGQVHQEVL